MVIIILSYLLPLTHHIQFYIGRPAPSSHPINAIFSCMLPPPPPHMKFHQPPSPSKWTVRYGKVYRLHNTYIPHIWFFLKRFNVGVVFRGPFQLVLGNVSQYGYWLEFVANLTLKHTIFSGTYSGRSESTDCKCCDEPEVQRCELTTICGVSAWFQLYAVCFTQVGRRIY